MGEELAKKIWRENEKKISRMGSMKLLDFGTRVIGIVEFD